MNTADRGTFMHRTGRLGAPLLASLLASLVLGAPAARADRGLSTVKEQPPGDRGGGILGAKVGVYLPQVFSPLLTSYFVEVEGGYVLPYVHRLLAITGSAALSSPTISGGGADPRLPSGGYTYELTQQQIVLGLTVTAKIPLGRVVPYVGIGPRLFVMRSASQGQAGGSVIPESVETSAEAGVIVPLGLDILLGPGRLFAEGQLLWAGTEQRTTGAAQLGAIAVAAGYRLVL